MVGGFAVLENKIPIALSISLGLWADGFYTLGLVSSSLGPVLFHYLPMTCMQESNTPWEICWWHQTGRCCWLSTEQGGLERLEHGTVSHGVKFNNSKCWILHLEQRNAGHNIHWERSAQTVGPLQLKILHFFLFCILKLWITLERGNHAWLVHRQANLGEDQKAFDVLPLLREAAEFCQWWISGEICSKPVTKCSPDQTLATLLTLYHSKHTGSLPNQWWAGRISCLKSDVYISLLMLWSLTHNCWTLSLCYSLKKQADFER